MTLTLVHSGTQEHMDSNAGAHFPLGPLGCEPGAQLMAKPVLRLFRQPAQYYSSAECRRFQTETERERAASAWIASLGRR